MNGTMNEMNERARRALEDLSVILEAGERGYAVAAANVNNRALKLLFKTYARQRADFRAEWRELAGRRGAPRRLVGLMAKVHRGRMDIFAALTIGEQNRERVVLKEVLVGESAALKAYERALEDGLPDGWTGPVERQYEELRKVVEQVRLLHGEHGRQLVVRLFDSQRDAQRALQDLQRANFDLSTVEQAAVEKETSSYQGERRGRLVETILSGVLGGAMWGLVSGALAGIGVLQLPGLGLEGAPAAVRGFAWAVTALAAIFSGGFVGGMLGTFIGWGIQGGDAYLYNESQQRGQVLVRLRTEAQRAEEAAQIMAQVNREARARQRQALA